MPTQTNQRQMTSAVYQIRNKVNGRVYIGASKQIEKRWYYHDWSLRSGNAQKKMQADYDELGPNAFVYEILEKCDPVQLKYFEAFWSNLIHRSGVEMYNYSVWGPSVMAGKTFSEETRAKMSKASKGRPKSAKHRKNMSIAHKKRNDELKKQKQNND